MKQYTIDNIQVGDKVTFTEMLSVGNDFDTYVNSNMSSKAGETCKVIDVKRTKFLIADSPYTYTPDMIAKISRTFGDEHEVTATEAGTIDGTVKEVIKVNEQPKPVSTGIQLDLGIDMNKIVTNAITNYITNNQELVNTQIKDEVKKGIQDLKPNIIKIPGKPDSKPIEGRIHTKTKEVIFLANSERQVYLAGPAGSGKTTMCSQVAQSMDLKFYHISCSAGMSEAHLLGRMLFNGEYVSSDFVKCYEEGGVFLFDEIDAADPNTLLVINSALANGILSVPNRRENPNAKRHDDFICICAGNTMGNGSVEYAGRNFLDAAFMDRFALAKVEIEYDMQLERDICEGHQDVFTLLTNIRAKIKANRLQKIISTRAFVSAVRLTTQGTTIENIKKILTIGWSDEEKRKCL